jgi:hypothetical protein
VCIKGKKFLEQMGNSNCLENKSAACSRSHGPFVRAVLNQRTTISTKIEEAQVVLVDGEGRNC